MMLSAIHYTTWFENASFCWVVLSALASLGANTGYSVALGCFVLHASIYRSPRTTLIAGGLTCLCLFVDVIYCALHGRTLQYSGHEYVFAYVLIILSMVVKAGTLFCAYQMSLADGYRFTSPIVGGPAGFTQGTSASYQPFGSVGVSHAESSLSGDEDDAETINGREFSDSYQNLEFGATNSKVKKETSRK